MVSAGGRDSGPSTETLMAMLLPEIILILTFSFSVLRPSQQISWETLQVPGNPEAR